MSSTQMHLRVLHLGNPSNIALNIVYALRQLGVDAVLAVDCSDFVTGEPAWEDERFSNISQPSWIQYYRNVKRHRISLGPSSIWFPYYHRLQQLRDLQAWVQEFNLLQAYNYDAALCLSQPHKPFVAFCIGGDLNVTALSPNVIGWLMRQAYLKARLVFYSNINMLESVRKLGLTHAHFMPLPVDTQRYAPQPIERDFKTQLQCDLLLFSPTRHAWKTKGNDKLLRAFAELIKSCNYKVKLILCEWGEDLVRSKALCCELKIQDSVIWLPLMPKRELLHYYSSSDIVLDQFNLGAFGLTALEAMACEKPIVINYREDWARQCYDEEPPVYQAKSPEEIVAALGDLSDHPQKCVELGQQAREWVLRYHSAPVVAKRHLEFYRTII